jgi:hypothetical protein
MLIVAVKGMPSAFWGCWVGRSLSSLLQAAVIRASAAIKNNFVVLIVFTFLL